MNAFDYFFETSKELDKDFIKGPRETISFFWFFRMIAFLLECSACS